MARPPLSRFRVLLHFYSLSLYLVLRAKPSIPQYLKNTECQSTLFAFFAVCTVHVYTEDINRLPAQRRARADRILHGQMAWRSQAIAWTAQALPLLRLRLGSFCGMKEILHQIWYVLKQLLKRLPCPVAFVREAEPFDLDPDPLLRCACYIHRFVDHLKLCLAMLSMI